MYSKNHLVSLMNFISMITLVLPNSVHSNLIFKENRDSSNVIKNTSYAVESCDYFDGYWKKDTKSYPRWNPNSKLMESVFSCNLKGRKDDSYLNWRWKPRKCDFQRFKASELLKRLKNKRIAFVGDSLAKNHIYSLAGILSKGISPRNIKIGGKEIFSPPRDVNLAFFFTKFNLSLELYSTAFLVKEVKFPKGQESQIKVLLDISHPSIVFQNLGKVDLAIFNTGHWFNDQKLRQSGCFPVINGKIDLKMPPETVFRHALKTWMKWVNSNKSSKTQIVFRSFEPVHGRKGPRKCPSTSPGNQNLPILVHPFADIAGEIISKSKKSILYLDVTKMSTLRNDAHTFVPGKGGDCSHWCTPGVPDEWSMLMFAELKRRNWTPLK